LLPPPRDERHRRRRRDADHYEPPTEIAITDVTRRMRASLDACRACMPSELRAIFGEIAAEFERDDDRERDDDDERDRRMEMDELDRAQYDAREGCFPSRLTFGFSKLRFGRAPRSDYACFARSVTYRSAHIDRPGPPAAEGAARGVTRTVSLSMREVASAERDRDGDDDDDDGDGDGDGDGDATVRLDRVDRIGLRVQNQLVATSPDLGDHDYIQRVGRDARRGIRGALHTWTGARSHEMAYIRALCGPDLDDVVSLSLQPDAADWILIPARNSANFAPLTHPRRLRFAAASATREIDRPGSSTTAENSSAAVSAAETLEIAKRHLLDAFPIRGPDGALPSRVRDCTLDDLCHIYAANADAVIEAYMQDHGHELLGLPATDRVYIKWECISTEFPVHNPYLLFRPDKESVKTPPKWYETRADAIFFVRDMRRRDKLGKVIVIEHKMLMEQSDTAGAGPTRARLRDMLNKKQCLTNAYMFMACVGVLPAYAVVIFATRRTEMQDREVAPDESVAYVAAIPLDLTQPLQLRLAVRAFLNPFNEKDATRHYLDGEQFIYGAESVYPVDCDPSDPDFSLAPALFSAYDDPRESSFELLRLLRGALDIHRRERGREVARDETRNELQIAVPSPEIDTEHWLTKRNFLSGDAFSAASSASKYNNTRASAGDALGVVIDGVFVSGGVRGARTGSGRRSRRGLFSGYALRTVVAAITTATVANSGRAFDRGLHRLLNARVHAALCALTESPIGSGWFERRSLAPRYDRYDAFLSNSNRGQWTKFVFDLLSYQSDHDDDDDADDDSERGDEAPVTRVIRIAESDSRRHLLRELGEPRVAGGERRGAVEVLGYQMRGWPPSGILADADTDDAAPWLYCPLLNDAVGFPRVDTFPELALPSDSRERARWLGLVARLRWQFQRVGISIAREAVRRTGPVLPAYEQRRLLGMNAREGDRSGAASLTIRRPRMLERSIPNPEDEGAALHSARNIDTVESQLAALNHTVKEIRGDGNCCFYAVAHAVGLTDSDHDLQIASTLRFEAAKVLRSYGEGWRIIPGISYDRESLNNVIANTEDDRIDENTSLFRYAGDVQLKALAVYFRRDIYCLQYRMQPVADGTVRANNNTKVFYHDPTIFPVARLSERRGNIIELRDFYASIPFERVERVLSTITHNRADRTKPILISYNGAPGLSAHFESSTLN
ncbi:hypothetical protein CYMTET_21900, partial [Cymbomonas tetramitiformis]